MSKAKTAQLHKSVRPYTFADNKKSVIQILNTILPLFIFWTLAYVSISYSILLALAFTILASGFIIRTFIIFHDCTHGSFFHNKKLNDTIGTITGVLTFFPYAKWKREHAIHHASSSNLDARGVGDIWVMTVDEYEDGSKWQRDRKSTRLNSSHVARSYAGFCLNKKRRSTAVNIMVEANVRSLTRTISSARIRPGCREVTG